MDGYPDRGAYLPLAPLERQLTLQLGCRGVRPRFGDSHDPHLASTAELAEAAGISGRVWTRWRREGRLPLRSADRAAIRAGFHPAEIWPEFCEVVS